MQPTILIAGTGFPLVRVFLAEELPGAAVHAVEPEELRAGATGEVLIPAMTRVDGAFMDGIRRLRLVQQWGSGLEGVDVAAASARGLAVANVPTEGTGNAESVAEWCVMAALALSRRLPALAGAMSAGAEWGAPMGRALLGRTAGIVGLGGIGQALAARLRPFGLRLVAVKRRPDPSLAERLGLAWLGGMDELPTLLRQSDYLFLCLPLAAATRHLIDEAALALLPPGACLVNPSRGALVSEVALLRALAAGRLLGAGVDVFEREPLPAGSPLLGRRDVLATPHVAGVTELSYRGIARGVAANVRRLLAGEPLLNCVNSEALARRS
jgi:phosphoglycerate dehydrogenase-like enzyme